MSLNKKTCIDLSFLFLVSICGLICFSYNLNSWKYSFVGDEWSFYTFARSIADQNFALNPFSSSGVFSEHAVLGSFWQALFLKMNSSHLFWRFSNIILILPMNVLFFYFLKRQFSRRAAYFGTIGLSSSFFLANFLKIGYLNPIALFLFLLCMYLAAKTAHRNRILDFIALGCAFALSFFVYIGPLFPFILWPLFIPAFFKKKARFIILRLLALSLPLVMLLSLRMVTEGFVFGGIRKTALHKEFTSPFQFVVNIGNNLILFFKNNDLIYNHFVSGPYVDIITQFLILIGLVICIKKLKTWNYASFFACFLLTAIVLGITSPYPYSPVTRGMFYLPFGFAFAALGLEWISKKTSFILVVTFILCIGLLNIYESQIGVFKRSGFNYPTLVIREMQHMKEKNQHTPIVLVMSESYSFDHGDIPLIAKAYGLDAIPFQMAHEKKVKINCSLLRNVKSISIKEDQEIRNKIKGLHCKSPLDHLVISRSYADL